MDDNSNLKPPKLLLLPVALKAKLEFVKRRQSKKGATGTLESVFCSNFVDPILLWKLNISAIPFDHKS